MGETKRYPSCKGRYHDLSIQWLEVLDSVKWLTPSFHHKNDHRLEDCVRFLSAIKMFCMLLPSLGSDWSPAPSDTWLWLAGCSIVMFWGVLHDATCFVCMTEAAWHTDINDSRGLRQIINPRIKIINPPLTWWHPLWNFIRVGAMVGFFSWRSTSPASCLIVLNWNSTSLSSSILLCRIPIRTWRHKDSSFLWLVKTRVIQASDWSLKATKSSDWLRASPGDLCWR